jgi:predicted nucleotidyltransferase
LPWRGRGGILAEARDVGGAVITLDAIRGKRWRLLNVAARHGARNLRVFGSVARGEADAGSDLDLLVDLEPGRSLIDLGALLVELEAELGTRVDVVTEAGLRPAIREQVLRDAVPP